jgi:hypothetical protein
VGLVERPLGAKILAPFRSPAMMRMPLSSPFAGSHVELKQNRRGHPETAPPK